MYPELKAALLQCEMSDLKKGLGDDIVSLTEYISDDLTKRMLVETAIGGFGKELLDRSTVRYILLVNCLGKESILDLAEKLNIKGNDWVEIAMDIASIPFGRNNYTTLILNKLKLDLSYLPEKNEIKEEDSFYISKDEEGFFYEQLDYQFDVRRKLIKHFKQQNGARSLIHMPTGAGKTKTAMHIIQELWSGEYQKRGTIIWLAHSEELLRQAISTFQEVWKYLGPFDVEVQKLWGRFELNLESSGTRIIFAGIQKLQSILKKSTKDIDSLIEGLNLVVVDECHKAPAKKTHELIHAMILKKNIYDKYPNLLGLTATPGRSGGYDIEDLKLRLLFDNVKIGIDVEKMVEYDSHEQGIYSEIELLQKRNILSTFNREPIHIERGDLDLSASEISKLERSIGSDADKELDAVIIDKIAKNKKRNKLILDKLLQLNNNSTKTIFFACNVAHAKLINAALYINNVKSGLILGETSSYKRDVIIKEFKDNHSDLNILVNVGVLTTGFDSPNIDCVFISRPVASVILYSQMIGRGIRGPLMGGKAICTLIDVVDNLNFGDEKWAFNYFDKYWK